MGGDLATLAADLSPYVTAAISAYGGAVLARTQEEAADATVGWGRRILQRLFGVDPDQDDVPDAVTDLAADPDDTDLQAALRLHIRKILATDPTLAEEIRGMLDQAETAAATVTATTRGVAIGGDNTAPVTTGDNSPITHR